MDSRTGELYPTLAEALKAEASDPVEITGTPEAVQRISKAVRAAHKAKRAAQKKSRRANRG